MVNSDRYPHVLKYTTPGTEGGYNEETGMYEPGTPGIEMTVVCRAKPNTAGKQERFQDGSVQEYAFDLGFPKGTQKIQVGVTASILGIDGELLFQGPLLRFQEGVYSVRGWI